MANFLAKLSVMMVMASLGVKSSMDFDINTVPNKGKRWQKTRAIE